MQDAIGMRQNETCQKRNGALPDTGALVAKCLRCEIRKRGPLRWELGGQAGAKESSSGVSATGGNTSMFHGR